MASHSYGTLGFSLLQELGSNEFIKKSRVHLVNPGGIKHGIIPELSFNLKAEQLELEPWKPFCFLKKSNHFVEFQRFDSEVQIDTLQQNVANLDAVKSPKKTRVNRNSPKKQNQKIRDRENDLNKRHYFYTCETLLSLMACCEEDRQVIMKSCGEDLLEILTHVSIGIAVTGIGVFCNVALRRVPFCSNKVYETSLSFSLVMLSWAVSRLREAIVDVNRKAVKDEELTNRVERRIKDVYLRVATVIAMIALRFR